MKTAKATLTIEMPRDIISLEIPIPDKVAKGILVESRAKVPRNRLNRFMKVYSTDKVRNISIKKTSSN